MPGSDKSALSRDPGLQPKTKRSSRPSSRSSDVLCRRLRPLELQREPLNNTPKQGRIFSNFNFYSNSSKTGANTRQVPFVNYSNGIVLAKMEG